MPEPKQIIAVSRGTYKRKAILETKDGFAVLYGLKLFVSSSLKVITSIIDWFDLKKN